MKITNVRKMLVLFLMIFILLGPLSATDVYADPQSPITVYITNTGTKYHRDNCEYLKNSKISISLDDAIAAGYSPCSKCNPPTSSTEIPIPTPSVAPSPQPLPKSDTSDITNQFYDVQPGKWYSKADGPISYVIKNGIMNGISNNSFNPEGECTREMFVQILYNAEGKQSVNIQNPFTDNEEGKWYYNAILWGVDRGITSGTSATTFGTGKNVTRQEMAGFLYNYAKSRNFDTSASKDLSSYIDASQISNWAIDKMKWANANGIINGKSSINLDPTGTATRAEVAQMIMNFQNKFGR